MRINLKLSNEEKQQILENHNIFKKVLLEKKRNQIIVEGFEDEVRVLRKALDTPCKETVGASLKKTKGGKAILYVQSSSKADSKNNYAAGDMIIYYADKGTEPYTYLAKSKNPTTKRVKDFNWVCVKQGGTSPVDLYATEEDVEAAKQEAKLKGYVDFQTAKDRKFDFTQPNVTYAKKDFKDGTILYKDLKGANIQSAATGRQEEKIKKVTEIYGPMRTDTNLAGGWQFDAPSDRVGWSQVTVPDPNGLFPEGIKIWVTYKAQKAARDKVTGKTSQAAEDVEVTNNECKEALKEFFGLYKQYLAGDTGVVMDDYFENLKRTIKRCRIEFCGDDPRFCNSGNRFVGLGNEYDKYVDFFVGNAKLSIGKKSYGFLQVSQFRID